jgi:hypothetical protein
MKNVLIIIQVLLMAMIISGTAFSAYDDIGVGARPLGMGGAFVAVADDCNASAYNPAGIGYARKPEVGFTHIILFSGVVNYNHAGIIVPLGGFGGIGMSFGVLQEESAIYSEKTYILTYSKRLIEALSLGANLKVLNTGYDKESEWVKENPFFAKASTSGFTFDVGLLAKPVSGLSIGVMGSNLAPVDMSISGSMAYRLSVPMNLRFGLAYRLSAIAASAQQPALKEVLETTLLSVEGGSGKDREVNNIKAKAGIEAWFVKQTVGLRAGYSMKKVDKSSSSNVNLGASLKIPISDVSMRLDYAIQILGGDLQEKLNHRISIAVSM